MWPGMVQNDTRLFRLAGEGERFRTIKIGFDTIPRRLELRQECVERAQRQEGRIPIQLGTQDGIIPA